MTPVETIREALSELTKTMPFDGHSFEGQFKAMQALALVEAENKRLQEYEWMYKDLCK